MFEILKGKIITKIEGLEKDSEKVLFTLSDGKEYEMYHEQDCCESVSIEDVNGDVEDLLNSPILLAEEVSSDENPKDLKIEKRYQDSFTWTFYKLATIKGSMTIRWYGESNGYYSESVEFIELR